MKKIFLALLLFFCIGATAQTTAELFIGKQQKIFLERTFVTDNSCTFGYLEATYGGGVMFKAFHEQKFWKAPIYGHVEYQTTFDGNHVYVAGVGLYKFLKNGFLELCPMYKYDGKSNWNLSFIYLLNWKYIELYGYNHVWGQNKPCFFGEQRVHFKIGNHFRIGGALDISYFDKFSITPMFGLRYDF